MKSQRLSTLIVLSILSAPLAMTAPAAAEGTASRTAIEIVAPEYPRAAERRGVEGSVTVRYTVSPEGVVTAAEVISATPEGVFDRAALHAVDAWRFEPAAAETVLTRELEFNLAG